MYCARHERLLGVQPSCMGIHAVYKLPGKVSNCALTREIAAK
jgi:hypothetical protein